MPLWLLYPILATIAGGLSIALAKIGMKQTSENVALFIRTSVLFSSVVIIGSVSGDLGKISEIDKKSLIILIATGLMTAVYWLLYFKALKLADASHIAAIDKASIIVTVLFSVIFLKEQITLRASVGIFLILVGCILVVFKGN